MLGQIGREHRRLQSAPHALGVDLRRREHAPRHLQSDPQLVRGVEDGLLIFLEVLVVGRRARREERRERRLVARQARGLAPQEFERVGVALLGHERRARRVALPKGHERELFRPVNNQILGPPRQVHAEQRRPLRELDGEVAVRDRVHGIGSGTPAKLEGIAQLPALLLVEEGVARQSSRAERAPITARPQRVQPLRVARPRPGVAHQPVRISHRLGSLEMRVAGHEGALRFVRSGHVSRIFHEASEQ
mmetsp:Transcript_25444/g.71482  ORF Transcript_25444/g.71482 Transcript_25444/m.71482 type:complete len:248 (-) Transcript_25444:567-1310(-)